MNTERLDRRLAAILALDVVGYSRMMGRDEEGTLGRLNHIRRSIIDSTIARHEGAIVKTTGDGVLAEFKSARDAIVAAREIQDLLHTYNAGQPAPERMDARIGVNIGDVIFHDNDVFGDGVNIAARLEAEAPPGGICISGRALEDLRKLAFGFEDRGEVLLKNIENPVRVLCVHPPEPKPEPEPPVAEVEPPVADVEAPVSLSSPPSESEAGEPAATPVRRPVKWGAVIATVVAVLAFAIFLATRPPHQTALEKASAEAEASAFTDAGNERLANGDLNGAIDQFQIAHRKWPEIAEPLKGWGDALARQGRWSEALRKYDEALKIAPAWQELQASRKAAAAHVN